MSNISFIKNWEMLQEDHRDDPTGFEAKVISVSTYFDKLPPGNSIVGFIGKFGTGKSALLQEVKKMRVNSKPEKWWQFDAWKYQNKSSLWESFLLDFIDENKGWRHGKIIRRKFIGKRYFFWQSLVVLTSAGIGVIFQKNNILPFWFVPFMPLFGVFLSSLFYDFPINHLSELQKEFLEYINSHKKDEDLFIVLEDIDRSNDSGINFLETLSYLLRNCPNTTRKIVIIATINKDGFKNNLSAYEKCLDFMYFSQLPNPDMYKFVDNVFDEKIFSENGIFREQIARFLHELNNLPDGSIRKIKLLLRDAAVTCDYLGKGEKEYDWRMIIVFTAMRYFEYPDPDKRGLGTYAEYYENRLMERDIIFGRMMLAIIRSSKDLNYAPGEKVVNFKFLEVNSAIPVHYVDDTQAKVDVRYRNIMIVR